VDGSLNGGFNSHRTLSMVLEVYMKEEEMKQRLEAGENAIDISIDKWVKLQQKAHAQGVVYDGFFNNTCALCHVHSNKCGNCVLGKLYDVCGKENSSWSLATHQGRAFGKSGVTEDSAEIMIAALKRAKKYLIDIGSYDNYGDCQKIKEAFEKKQKEEQEEFHFGDHFKWEGSDSLYVLARVGRDQANFINIEYGSRLVESFDIGSMQNLTGKSIGEKIGEIWDELTKVESFRMSYDKVGSE